MRRVAAGVLVALALLVPATAQGQTDGDTAATSTVQPTTTDRAAVSAPEPTPDTTTSVPPGDVGQATSKANVGARRRRYRIARRRDVAGIRPGGPSWL